MSHFYEMLEGQVAVLSSGYLSAAESIEVLEALRKSAMFREDQYSYILYPDRPVPAFIEKNNIPAEALEKSELLQALTTITGDCGAGCQRGLPLRRRFTNKNVLLRRSTGWTKPGMARASESIASIVLWSNAASGKESGRSTSFPKTPSRNNRHSSPI